MFAQRARADVELPPSNPDERITVTADSANRWSQGAYEVWILRGNCLINQGLTYAHSQEAVLWIEPGPPGQPNKMIAYLEGEVVIDYQQPASGASLPTGALKARMTDKTWLGRFYSTVPATMRVPQIGGEPLIKAAVWEHGLAARDPQAAQKVVPAQFAEPNRVPTAGAPATGARRIRAFPRSDVRVQAQWFPNPAKNEYIAVISSGVNLIVDGIDGFGSIDVKTDRLVLWTSGVAAPDLSGQNVQGQDTPLELYMEGNIEFRQGDRVLYAQRMYYDVRRQTGTVLGAELIGGVPNYDGIVRLRADVIQQIERDRFLATNASVTTSRFGVPGYEFRAGSLELTDIQTPVFDPATGAPQTNPQTGEPLVAHQRRARSNNNTLYIEEVPVFYWPTISTNLEKPNYYVERALFKQDQVFGTQFLLDLDAYQIFGIDDPPAGTNWDLSLDYLSDRGFAAGTTFDYDRTGLFGILGRYYGLIDLWGLHDSGLDNLGRNRRALVPERDDRGRIFGRHRQFMPDNFQLTLEAGVISDRNFLEQYFEQEWDELKDQNTGFELKQLRDNSSISLSGDVRVNSFFTQTEGARIDHFLIGQPLLGDSLTWFEHSQAGYMRLGVLTTPEDPNDVAGWGRLPWEIKSQGERLVTRQEIDLPLDAGPVKVVPYALGELAHWGEVLDGSNEQRAYGQVGVRASVPFWAANPEVQSQLWNLNGIAHKVVFDADLGFSEANRNVEGFPLYDPLNDDNIEDFQRRFPNQIFGAVPPVPARFDERLWAIRSGLGSWVTSPATEVVGDLVALRLGARQRWQTKRGGPNNQKIVDWITLDTEGTIFPRPDQDNFGETLGMLNYDFKWHIGDRLTLVSDGYYETYDDGPKYTTIGAFINRPPRGSLYLGFRSLEGPIESNIIAAAYSYRMSPKYVSTFGTTFDISGNGNIGQNFTIARVGESFIVSAGMNVDASKGNVGLNFAIEPRFLTKANSSGKAGLIIPPAGAFGLE